MLNKIKVFEWVDREIDVPEGPHNAMIAPEGANYPPGKVVDLICVTCGRCFASHDENDVCGN